MGPQARRAVLGSPGLTQQWGPLIEVAALLTSAGLAHEWGRRAAGGPRGPQQG